MDNAKVNGTLKGEVRASADSRGCSGHGEKERASFINPGPRTHTLDRARTADGLVAGREGNRRRRRSRRRRTRRIGRERDR